MDTESTKVNFTLGDVLHTVHGVFKLTKGDLWFNPKTAEAGGLMIVAAQSGNSGNRSRDGRMNKSILHSDSFPDIAFTPDRVDGQVNISGDSTFRLHGALVIQGKGHELNMNVKAHLAGADLTATATFDVPYVEWGMKNPSTLFLRVNDTVQIEIKAIGHIVGPKDTA